MCRFSASIIVLTGFAIAGSAAPAPKDKTPGEKLLGTWKLVRGGQQVPEDVTFFVEFAKEGKMSLRIQPKNKDVEATILKGTYKHSGEKIDYTLETGQGGTKQEVLTVNKLTASELVVTDPDGIKEEFEREKPDKKVKKE